MSKYQILRTAKADEQISDIIHYVAADSGDPMVALACLDRMEQEIRRLEDFPSAKVYTNSPAAYRH